MFVELIHNKSFYLFTLCRTHAQANAPFTKPFVILLHPSLLSFAQSVTKHNLRPSCLFHLLNFFQIPYDSCHSNCLYTTRFMNSLSYYHLAIKKNTALQPRIWYTKTELSPVMAMIKQPIKPTNPLQFPLYSTVRQNLPLKSFLSTSISSATKAFGRLTCKCNAFCFEMSKDVGALVREFDPAIPLDKAVTPPSSWYTNSAFLPLEMERVFYRGWQAVGFLGQVENPHDFFTGRLGNVQFVICRDGNGDLHAFHNVCRHHASLVASGSGRKSCFVCPYHGWTYGLDGMLQKATRISGIQNFSINEYGLFPINLATWGPFVLINLDDKEIASVMENNKSVENEWLGSSSEILANAGIDQSLEHVARREYIINCNWKVFCDNYLDGGYHVPYAHGGLAAGLNLGSYLTTLFEKVSIQTCQSAKMEEEENFDRLGKNAVYAFIYPNFMINRYGPWMDTNLVVPLGTSKCQVIFDYFLEDSHQKDKAFIERSLLESDRVQMEDISLSEGVQAGLTSPAYKFGRYAPRVEMALHHFHCLLYGDLVEP